MCVYVCMLARPTDLDPWFGLCSAGWEQDVEMTAVTRGGTIRCSRQLIDRFITLSVPLQSQGPDTQYYRPNAASLAQFLHSLVWKNVATVGQPCNIPSVNPLCLM